MQVLKSIWDKFGNWVLIGIIVAIAVLQPQINRNIITFKEAIAAGTADYSLGTNGTANLATITSAINALPSSGGLLHFKGGTYNISGNITLRNGVTFEGEGQGITTVLFNGGGNGTSVFVVGNGSSVTERGSSITHLSINATGTGYGVYAKSGLHSLIDDVEIKGATLDGIRAVGASSSIRPDYLTITRSWIHLNGMNGIYTGQWTNAIIINANHISDNGNGANITAGVTNNGSSDLTISNNQMWQNNRSNIIQATGTNIQIIGNDLNDVQYENVWVRGDCNTVKITGNSISNASLSGTNNASSIVYGAAPSEGVNQLNVTGNTFLDTENKMARWISGAGSGGTGVIASNTYRGTPATAPFAVDWASFAGTNNLGTTFKTEAHVTVTITAGQLSGSASHGMGLTPNKVYVTTSSSSGNYTGAYWPGWNGSTITVNADAVSNVTVSFECIAITAY